MEDFGAFKPLRRSYSGVLGLVMGVLRARHEVGRAGCYWCPARTRCINGRTLETGANHLEGSSDITRCQGRHDTNQAGRGEIHPRFPGEGVLMHYSSRPTNKCKGRSEPITENSSDAPPIRCFGPLAPDDLA